MVTTKKEMALIERDEARAELRAMLKPGDTVNVIQRSVSQSGMSRQLSLFIGTRNITHLAARAMGDKLDHKTGHAALKVGGCGMDMHFATVYNLSRSLWPDGHKCTGKQGCPSNDHSNDWGRLAREYADAHLDDVEEYTGTDGAANYCAARSEWIAAQPTYTKRRTHNDGGYALSHRTL